MASTNYPENCNKTAFHKNFQEKYSERPFNPEETLQWLTNNKIITMSWGFQSPVSLTKDNITTGLMFKVNGHHHKGWVLITLSWNDTYTLRFFSRQFKEKKEVLTNIYCDELQLRVDQAIEKIAGYSS